MLCFLFPIQLGPFVDSKHEQIEVGLTVDILDSCCQPSCFFNLITQIKFSSQKAQVTETFEAIFSRCIESIVDGTKR